MIQGQKFRRIYRSMHEAHNRCSGLIFHRTWEFIPPEKKTKGESLPSVLLGTRNMKNLFDVPPLAIGPFLIIFFAVLEHAFHDLFQRASSGVRVRGCWEATPSERDSEMTVAIWVIAH
jgi:hypothetical protein